MVALTDESSGSSLELCFKLVLVLILTILPCSLVLFALLSVGFVPKYYVGPSLLFSGFVFFIGAGALFVTKNVRHWLYSLVVGFLSVPACIVLTVIVILIYTPVPFMGNAFNVVFLAFTITGFLIIMYWPIGKSTVGAAPVQSSAKSLGGSAGSTLVQLFRPSPEQVLAVELVEMPHRHVFSEDTREPLDIVHRLYNAIRALSSIPVALRIQRAHYETRVLFLTWSSEQETPAYQLARLIDALRHNLVGFRFRECESFTGAPVREFHRGAAAIITGVPQVMDVEQQGQDTLEALAGVLQGMNNGIFQVFIEPHRSGGREIRALESEYQREMERSERTISKEKTTLFGGVQQESKTIVDPKAKLRAERLERNIRRLSNQRLCRVTVATTAWNVDVAKADRAARRLAGALLGSLRPADEHEDFKVHYTTKKRDVHRLLGGLPAGPTSILTTDEAAVYVSLPRTDLSVPVTSREQFSSGTRENQQKTDPTAQPERPSDTWASRPQGIYFGNPIDQAGRVLEDKYVVSQLDHFDMHFGIFGATRSGKTTTALSICSQAISQGVNPLILALTKGREWWPLTKLHPDVQVFTCGRDDIANLALNMWRPPAGVRLSKWIDRLVQIWTLWLPSDDVIGIQIDDLIRTIYDLCGYDRETEEGGRAILLPDLVDALEHVYLSLTYEDRVAQNFHGILSTRVRAILRRPALVRMYNTQTGVTIEDLLSRPTIVDMSELSDSDRTLLMGLLTAGVIEYKLAHPQRKVTNLLVLEEAHYLLGKTTVGDRAHALAVQSFVQMLRVLGGTGLGVMVIDQSPTELAEQALKVIVNLVVHALPHQEDRVLVGKHSRCTDAQIEHIGGMKVGEAVVYLQQEGEPKNVRVFPLEKFAHPGQTTDEVGEEALRLHMERIIDEHPEFQSREPLPDGLMERLKHPPVRTVRPYLTRTQTVRVSDQMQVAVTDPAFADYCRECLKRGDSRAIADLILSAAERYCGGNAALFLGMTMDEYMDAENAAVFRRVAALLDGVEAV